MIFLVLLLALAGGAEASAQDSSSAIREDLATQVATGLSDAEAHALAQRGLALGEGASSAKDLYNAMSAVAAVCAESPPATARDIRATALALLARSFHDSRRWSALLVEGFLPDFDRLAPESWQEELDRYEAVFDDLSHAPREGGTVERLEAELAWGQVYARVHLDRTTDWLREPQRREALARLERLASRFDALPIPGSHGAEATTVGDRARQAIEAMRSLAFGAVAPATTGVDLQGNPVDLRSYRGRVVILDFWTSFCLPCLAMVPHTRDVLTRLEDEAVSFFGVCGDETQQKGRATAKRVGMTWPSLWDGPEGTKGPLATTWHVDSWPTLYVLDGEGRIRFKFRSREDAEEGLETAVRKLLAELE